jgi:GTP1/Obg family GTP-binding protein
MIYTFREEAVIYTKVIANSRSEAWAKLDQVVYSIPECMKIEEFDCEIVDVDYEDENEKA